MTDSQPLPELPRHLLDSMIARDPAEPEPTFPTAPDTEELEQGGVWHADGILPCATGRPYPHQNTAECRMVARPVTTFREQREAFELPTVAESQKRITALEESLKAALAELSEAHAEKEHYHRNYAAALLHYDHLGDVAGVLVQTVRNWKHGDSTGPLDNAAAKVAAVLAANADDYLVMVLLTAKGEEYLDSIRLPSDHQGSEGGSVPHNAQEPSDSPIFDAVKGVREEVTESGALHHNGHYAVRNPSSFRASVPVVNSVNDRGETQEPVTSERYMMATHAHHTYAGQLSRFPAQLAIIHGEDSDDWVGEWAEGYGYVNVRFPKKTTRELTPAEIDHYDGAYIQIGAAVRKIQLRPTGDTVQGTSQPIATVGGPIAPQYAIEDDVQ
ncbi:hypothetical protein AB0M02_00305 [Actinoplanes sp. NPDC051861]|uniref:hypothetical protein n=1 Tax=Actinoplanes sp. NPDC051861 TaxID=3155170 RepID=UPI0034178496